METTSTSNASDLGVCLVTGGYGWVGHYIVAQLSQQGYTVRNLDISNSANFDVSIDEYCRVDHSKVHFVQCDLTDREAVIASCKGVDTVFHICAIVDVRPCPDPLISRVNIDGTKNIIDACIANHVKRVVYCSSTEAVWDHNRMAALDDWDESTMPILDKGKIYIRIQYMYTYNMQKKTM